MPTFTAANTAVSATAREIMTSAMTEINANAQGETPTAGDAAWCLEKLQRLIDRFNARQEIIFNVNFTKFTLQANHAPHTIGPTGDFVMAQRPIKLVAAALVLTSSGTGIDIPLNVRDDAWWAAQTIKSLTSTVPTDVYYSPDIPNGTLNIWPVPSAVNDIRLELWTGLTQALNLDTALAMPPAYWDFVVLTLARDISPSFGDSAIQIVQSPIFQATFREARNAVTQNNMGSPRLVMDTPGAGEKSGTIPTYNFLTGMRW